MTPLEQLDAYAAQDRWFKHDPKIGTGDTRDECAPKAFDALRAVLDIADDCRRITGARTVGESIESAITTALAAS